jgi:hypothetical protein
MNSLWKDVKNKFTAIILETKLLLTNLMPLLSTFIASTALKYEDG